MSFPTTDPLPPDAPTSVFVDESGRRRARTRVVARVLVAGALVYAFVVIAGLTGSVSLPGVHLGELKRAAPGHARSSALGPGSKAISLPAELAPRRSKIAAARRATEQAGAGVAPGTTSPSGGVGGSAPGATTSTPGTSAGATTTLPSPTTTVAAVTTTTRPHGRPTTTTTPHGQPSTLPGQRKGQAKL
ncbi:MAG: hypothetical protein QOI44_2601 [Actinomycetota bacterium]|jgi:hypothetical protein|nr:hypothetical protein [Actinomycetota bacterium]